MLITEKGVLLLYLIGDAAERVLISGDAMFVFAALAVSDKSNSVKPMYSNFMYALQ